MTEDQRPKTEDLETVKPALPPEKSEPELLKEQLEETKNRLLARSRRF